MSRVLVAYSCHFGRARAVADELALRLRRRGHDVEVANARAGRLPPPHDYDAVVLGSPVRHGQHDREIRDYVREFRDELRAMPTAYFSVSLAARFGGHDTPHAWKVADLVTESLAEQPIDELSPAYGPI